MQRICFVYSIGVHGLNRQFLDGLHQQTSSPHDVNSFLGQLESLDYDTIQMILDRVEV